MIGVPIGSRLQGVSVMQDAENEPHEYERVALVFEDFVVELEPVAVGAHDSTIRVSLVAR